MTLELVKYPYGTTVRYTAFCLTPRLKKPRIVNLHGKSVTMTSEGISSVRARHFETPDAVLGYLRSSGHKVLNLDFSPLPGTAIRREA